MFDQNIQELLRWAWIVVAVFFFLTEVFTAGIVLMCFGVGALAAALTAFLGAGLAWQIVVFIVVSAVAVLLSRPIAARISRPGVQQIAGDRVIGKWAVVLQTVDPLTNTGMVRVESERWRAESMEGEQLEAGEVVEIVGVEGVRLLVRAKNSAADAEDAESDQQTDSPA